MARFSVEGMDELLSALQLEAERMERNGPAALEAAAEKAVDAMNQTVPRRHGDLARSIKAGPVKKGFGGDLSVEIYPQGMKKQVGKSQRFETIGFVLEYGRSNMAAQPWMDPAMEKSGDAILDTLEAELMKD